MSSNRLQIFRLRVFAPLLALGLTATASYGQTQVLATPRVFDDVNTSQMVAVKGGTLPLAQARFDRGRVSDGTPTGHMMIVLKRSDAQEQALQQLMAAQQDAKSPSYHKWLTPESFGAQFGVADADVQAVSSYLSSQGFTVGRVFKNKMAIEFSGTVGQVRSSFKTEIHSYVVNGQTFHANATAPQIPAALAPVVSGFAAMNSYKSATPPVTQQMLLDRKTGRARSLYADQTDVLESVSPGDLAAIYDIPTSTYTGTGVTVGIVSDSNINVAIPANYRTTFGLPANPPTVIVDGNDPGILADASVTYGQVELVAATAPAAKVNVYTAASTQLESGLSFASVRALEDNTVQVLVFGYEGCEADLGMTNNLFNAIWEQAAAQGISVVAGSGTGGSAGCDANPTSPESQASRGLAVNGYASTPYDTAVGSSDFYYGPTGTLDPNNLNSFSKYWNTTNGTTSYTSAKGYIPEQPNNASLQSTNQASPFAPEVFATGGGLSTLGLTSDDGSQTFYPRPSYQLAAAKAIVGTARVIPDVSIFGGFNNASVYITCATASDCVGSTAQPGTLQYTAGFRSSGFAAATFGGIAALVVQAKGPQGNLNPALYATYAAAPAAFHDITAGTNAVQCSGGPNCAGGYLRTPAGGVLAFKAGTGYDAASGLGSVDVANLISNWTTPSGVATIALAIAPGTFHHGDAAQLTVSVAGAGGTPTGDVAITTSTPQNRTLETLTLANGTATDDQIGALLPAGTYQVTARYAGDSNFAPAIASSTVTVYQVQSAMAVLAHDLQNKPLPAYTGQTLTYGSTVQFSFQVYSASDKNDRGVPSGAIVVYDNGNKASTVLLNSEGYATFTSSTLAPGSHSFSATYAGDNTYGSTSLASGFPKLVIGGAPTQTLVSATGANLASRNSVVQLVATVAPTATPQCNAPSCLSAGAAPGGSVRFTAGGALLGTANLNLGMNTGTKPSATAVFTLGRQALPAGTASIVATYVPDSTGNYTGSTSAPFSLSVAAGTGYVNTNIKVVAVPAGAVNFANTGSVGFNATVSVAAGNPVATGNVNFFANGGFIGAASLDNTGAASFTVSDPVAILPLGQNTITAQYVGDSTHASSATSYTINVYDGTSTPDFSMQSDPQYQNVSASSTTANFSLQFTSLNNLAALGTPIALTYTAPRGFTCSGAPTAPNFNGGTTATVTVSCGPSAGSTVALLSKPNSNMLWMAEGGAALACVFLFGMPARRRSWQSLIGAMALIVVAFGVTGCGVVSSVSGKDLTGGLLDGKSAAAAVTITPGTYNLIVTGTARVFVKSQPNTTVTVVHNLPLKIVVN